MAAEKLIEYRTVQHSSLSEASTYLTTDRAQVRLQFENPLICSMLTGRKEMRIAGSSPFAFLPGETLLINSSMQLDIKFPQAAPDDPTECMVIEFDRVELDRIVTQINDTMDRKGQKQRMELDWKHFAHLREAPAVNEQMQRVMAYYENEQGQFREALIEAAHSELVLRLLQAQATELFVANRANLPDTGLTAVLEAIRSRPEARYSSEDLAHIAKMSEATLFRHFKAKYGVSPAKFATVYRMRLACDMLASQSITAVSYALGYSDATHFSRVFREVIGETPGEVRRRSRAEDGYELILH